MARPNQTHDRLDTLLDALLDGQPREVTDDLAPLLAAAAALRDELAEFELDPEVVDRHLEQALDRPATVVPLPVREERGGGLRRRLVAVGLAAALVLVPATAASAASSSALPGQPLYPVKIAFEQFRLAAVQWSPTAEAHERTRLAAIRLKELDKLVQLRMVRQILPAIHALDKAVVAAHAAVKKAIAEEGADPELVAAASKLQYVEAAGKGELNEVATIVNQLPLPSATRAAITQAVDQSQVQNGLPTLLPSAPPGTAAASSTTASSGQGEGGSPGSAPSAPTSVATTKPEQLPPPPPSTAPPSTTESTTTETTVTTVTTLTTAASPNQGNSSGAGGAEGTPAPSTSGP
jgi:hypothetical protein